MAEKKNNRRILKKIIFILVVVFAVAFIFNAVMFVVGIKTDHFHRWAGEQYFGEIIEISGDSFVIKGRTNEKRTILITEKTVFKKGSKTVQNALKVGDRVIVFCLPDKNNQIESQLVRVFDRKEGMNLQKLFHLPF